MSRKIVWGAALGLATVWLSAGLAAPTLNYQGRITAAGMNHTGFGYFKFVLLNGEGDGVWANDGSSGAGEPGGAVTGEVNNGLFNIELGQDMNPIPATAFHESNLVLRTWFSTNGTAFELLAPDVAVHPTDLARLDTGRTLVVDADGKGDFQDLQQAIDFYSSNPYYRSILVMPGTYTLSVPLNFPTNRFGYSVFGLGDKWNVMIENPSGPAAYLQNVDLQNVHLVGNPAVSDAVLDGDYENECKRCVFSRHLGSGPAVELRRGGGARFFECDIENSHEGPALRLVDDGGIDATHCNFLAEGMGGPAVEITNNTAGSLFESCSLDASEAGDPSLKVYGTSGGQASFQGCRFGSGIQFDGLQYVAKFSDCRIDGGIELYGGAAPYSGEDTPLEFEECRVGSSSPAQSAMVIEGEHPNSHVWLRNCNLYGESNATLHIHDSIGEIRVKDCEIHCDSGPAVEVICDEWLAEGWSMDNISFYRSRILNGSSSVSNQDAIVVTNDPSRAASKVHIDLTDCEVTGNVRDGLGCTRCNVGLVGSTISADRHGIRAVDAEVQIMAGSIVGGDVCGIVASNSSVSLSHSAGGGKSHGILATGTSSVTLVHSSFQGAWDESAEGDGIHASGPCSVILVSSSLDSRTGDGVYYQATGERFAAMMNSYLHGENRGAYLSADPTSGYVLLSNCGVSGEEDSALECEGGILQAANCWFQSAAGAGVFLRYTNTTASFDSCSINYGASESNTNGPMVLYGTPSDPPPTPRVSNCRLQYAAGVGNSPYAVRLYGGATTGTIALANSVICTNLDPRIGIVPLGTPLANGNYIAP